LSDLAALRARSIFRLRGVGIRVDAGGRLVDASVNLLVLAGAASGGVFVAGGVVVG